MKSIFLRDRMFIIMTDEKIEIISIEKKYLDYNP